MSTHLTTLENPQVGDWVEIRGVHGQTPRRGEIVELIGEDRHLRYRVRWDEKHESIVYPADGVMVVHGQSHAEHVDG